MGNYISKVERRNPTRFLTTFSAALFIGFSTLLCSEAMGRTRTSRTPFTASQESQLVINDFSQWDAGLVWVCLGKGFKRKLGDGSNS